MIYWDMKYGLSMFYSQEPNSAEDPQDDLEPRQGLYIYPDWSSCVEGVWQHHTLIQG